MTANWITTYIASPMMLTRTRKKFLRSPLLAVLLVALIFRAAIPVGYMPVTAPDGGMHMDICPDHEPSAPEPAGSRTDSHGTASHCPFALSAGPPLTAAHVVVAIGPSSLVEVRSPDIDSNITFAPTRTQQARAPPVSTQIDS